MYKLTYFNEGGGLYVYRNIKTFHLIERNTISFDTDKGRHIVCGRFILEPQ